MNTIIKCQFSDGSVESVPVDKVCVYIGRGVWGQDFIQHLADDHADAVWNASRDIDGQVIVESSRAS